MDLKGTLGPWAQEDQLDLPDLRGCLATVQKQKHQGVKESRELMESLGDRGSLGLKAKRYDLGPVRKVTRVWHIFIFNNQKREEFCRIGAKCPGLQLCELYMLVFE